MNSEQNQNYLEPESLYERPDLDKAELFAVEEFYAGLKYGGWRNLGTVAPEREEQVARAVEDLKNGREPAPELLPDAGAVLSSIRLMETEGRARVPEVLRGVVARSLAPEKAPESPSLVVRILKDTLDIVKSSYQNVSLQNAEALAVRSSAAPVRERADKFELRQVVSVDLTIFYEILRENGNEVMLRVHLEPEPPHCRVNLHHNGRIVTSLNYVRGTGGITFQRLAAGSYQIEIKGDDWNFATSVEIQDDN